MFGKLVKTSKENLFRSSTRQTHPVLYDLYDCSLATFNYKKVSVSVSVLVILALV